MDRAYEGDETRQLARELGYMPVVPPQAQTGGFLGSMTALYTVAEMKSNASSVGSKAIRRIFSRFEKLDVLFAGFIHFALIVEALR